jgi:glycosyltransferase involved in cell wall biosynthesis
MISIIVPAHNEEQVIRRSLQNLTADASASDFEIIVVCNGCSDRTAEIAAEFGPAVKVLETPIPSKANALNLGDAAAKSFPRVYADADVEMSPASIRNLVAPLQDGRLLASAPAVDTAFKSGTDWSVRAYYRFWMALPFVKEGMMAAGVYAVSEQGRGRFGVFPEIIADVGFVRLHFTPAERAEIPDAVSRVWVPARWADLIRIKTRSRLGVFQLRTQNPELFTREAHTKRYGRSLVSVLLRPDLYLAAIPFAVASIVSRRRAGRQLASGEKLAWERDVSSRAI